MPEKVQVQVAGADVKVKGPLGEMSYKLPAGLTIEEASRVLHVKKADNIEPSLYGVTRARVANMVEGVQTGFSKTLEIHGVGYRAALEGEKLTLSLGFSHPVYFTLPKGIKAAIDTKLNLLTLSGTDKEVVGETAAQIRSLKKPEPYKGTGIRYKGEHIVRKAGKTAAGAGAGGAGGKK